MSTSAPSTVPATGRSPRPVRGLGATLSIMLVVAAVIRAVTIVMEAWVRYDVMSQASGARAGTLGYAESIRSIKNVMLGVFGSTALVLVTGIVFLVWLSRTRNNAALLSPGPFRLGAGWAVGSWFVPLGNLVLPALVVTDTWRASHGTRSAGPVAAWWTALVASWVVGWAGLSTRNGMSTTVYETGLVLGVVQALLTIVAGILAVHIVRRISDAQQPAAAAARA